MSVAGISSTSALNQLTNPVNSFQQRASDFQELAQALQSGDLAGAQQAFSALTQLASNSGGSAGRGALAQDFNAIGQALQSGNLSAAQQAFATFQQDLEATWFGRFSGNGGRQAGSPAGADPATTAAPSTTDDAAATQAAPEIILNLSSVANSTTPTEITLDFSNSATTGEQLTIGVSNGNSTPQDVTLNLGSLAGSSDAIPEIVLNLGATTAAPRAATTATPAAAATSTAATPAASAPASTAANPSAGSALNIPPLELVINFGGLIGGILPQAPAASQTPLNVLA